LSGLAARGVHVRRGKTEVLHDITFVLRPGEAVALVGPNAAGKSTLVRTLVGLLPLSAGDVRLDERAVSAWPRDAFARRVALIAAEDDGASLLTVADRVRLGRYPHRGAFQAFTDSDQRAVDGALDAAGIVHLAGRRIGTLSAGERQLAALARGLAQEPAVLLLDEPGAHLDVGHQIALFRILADVRRSGVAVLAVVHDLQRAADWADRMVLLHEGRLVADGAPRDVLASPACASAFVVRIREHAVAGLELPLYSFGETRPGAGAP
jgi:iron complex transport system ATP-binding protein